MNRPPPRYTPFSSREGDWNSALESYAAVSAEIRRLEPLFVRVADVTDAERFPNIAAAIEHTRSQQGEE
jgi:hypothetical protein